jgi:hypothetical protein
MIRQKSHRVGAPALRGGTHPFGFAPTPAIAPLIYVYTTVRSFRYLLPEPSPCEATNHKFDIDIDSRAQHMYNMYVMYVMHVLCCKIERHRHV